MVEHRKQSDSAFVLVMMLMLLAIAAVSLAAVARSSLGLAVHALQQREAVQRKWTGHSIRQTMLPLAPRLIGDSETTDGKPAVFSTTQLILNGDTYTVTVCDEQVRVNINILLAYRGREAALSYCRAALADNRTRQQVFLPMRDESGAIPDRTANTDRGDLVPANRISSLNHLFPGFDPDLIDIHDPRKLAGLTCWGDGRINLIGAADEQVITLTEPLMGSIQIGRLRDAVSSGRDVTIEKALAQAGIRDSDIPDLVRRVTLESYCFSVRVSVDDGRRHWHQIAVIEQRSGDYTVATQNPNRNSRLDRTAVDVPQTAVATTRLTLYQW